MIWLGGLCVGLAGVFLVRYSIEQGLLGPGARILLAVATGVILHGVAEWLRRGGSASGAKFRAAFRRRLTENKDAGDGTTADGF